jgi:ADP-ribose pyrophosphatase YjhB (NUDIX family)
VNYCGHCGEPVQRQVPPGDNRERDVCGGCGSIHYENPKIVVGCVPEFGGRILLCRRAIEPRHGYWTMPAGFMENDETLAEAAARETWEEARARVALDDLFAVVDVVQARQVHAFFRGRMAGPEHAPGEESLETRLFAPADIPWDDIAFPSVAIALRRWLDIAGEPQPGVHLAQAPRRG